MVVVKCWWYLAVWGPGGRYRFTPIAHNITCINNNIFIRWRYLVYGQIMNIIVQSYCILSSWTVVMRTADLSGGKERRDSKQLIIVAPPSTPTVKHPPSRPTDQLLPRRAALARCSTRLLLSWSAAKGDDIQRAEVMEDWQTPRSPPPFHRQAHPHPQPPRSGGGFVKGGTIRNLQHDIDLASRLPLTIIT